MVGLEVPYERYCFDEAVYLWGRHITYELDAVRHKVKDDKDGHKTERAVKAKLEAILHPLEERREDEAPRPVPKGKFRDPMAMIGK